LRGAAARWCLSSSAPVSSCRVRPMSLESKIASLQETAASLEKPTKRPRIKEGDKIPEFEFKHLDANGKGVPVTVKEIFSGKRVVMFGVPGAFTPTCHRDHCPGFVQEATLLKQKGVDGVYCHAVNDPWVMDAWSKSLKADGKLIMLPDGDAKFAKLLGLEKDAGSLGLRSYRYALIAKDGVVQWIGVDEKGLEQSSVTSVMARL